MATVLFAHSSASPCLPRQAFERAVAIASARHRVAASDIKGRSRIKPAARARQHAMWLLRQDGFSYPEIGRAFGHADHTSAFSGVRAHAARIAAQTPYISEAA